ncbi:hypothetical protein [Magnetococcus sp. PR-3]|uniref:hypothetical protein n=1 Tax=Magnetococcus sp. PR-3 TaxID=3120355 RepID=UPI002FCE4A5E
MSTLVKHGLPILTTLLLLVLICAPVALLRDTNSIFDLKKQRQLQSSQPDLIFMGNSMLGTRLNADQLQAHFPHKTLDLIPENNSYSRSWYLNLKFFVATLSKTPDKVFILFRDQFLTVPWLADSKDVIPKKRTLRERRGVIQRMQKEDPTLERIQSHHQKWSDHAYDWTAQLFPIIRPDSDIRQTAQWHLDSIRILPFLKGYASHVWHRYVGAEVKAHNPDMLHQRHQLIQRINTNFTRDRLRQSVDDQPSYSLCVESDATTMYGCDFQASVADSYLPAMVQLAKDNGIQLVFVRIKRRPDAQGVVAQSDTLKRYITDLDHYLKAHQMVLWDLTDDEDIKPTFYFDGDHIHPQYKAHYTDLFATKMKSHFHDLSQF